MERGKLPTDLEFAPITREGLEEAIGSLACDGDCAYNTPRQDQHHLLFGDLSESEQVLRTHPDFKATICRCLHECVHKTWTRSEPVSLDFVIGYVSASAQPLASNQQKVFNRLRERR